MKSLTTWFDEYSESHRNPTNQLIHVICVPAIFYSVLGLLWAVNPILTFGLIAIATVFYLALDVKLALIMLLISIVCTCSFTAFLSWRWPFWQIQLGIFVLAWLGQAYGHKIEGKKPSFFNDIIYLLIGPLWILQKSMKT
jgi:uncharacterized membrane protein YGL010W